MPLIVYCPGKAHRLLEFELRRPSNGSTLPLIFFFDAASILTKTSRARGFDLFLRCGFWSSLSPWQGASAHLGLMVFAWFSVTACPSSFIALARRIGTPGTRTGRETRGRRRRACRRRPAQEKRHPLLGEGEDDEHVEGGPCRAMRGRGWEGGARRLETRGDDTAREGWPSIPSLSSSNN